MLESTPRCCPNGSLDEGSACKHFLGKTLTEAEALFREASLYYQEDLMWMGPRAFQFYLPAALNDLKSEAARGPNDRMRSNPRCACSFGPVFSSLLSSGTS